MKEEKENKDVFKIDRREFLKKMGAAGLGAIFGASMFSAKGHGAGEKANPPKVPDDVWDKILKNPKRYEPNPELVRNLLKEYDATEYVIVVPGLEPKSVKRAVEIYRAAGIPVSTKEDTTIGITGLVCGQIYYSYVNVNNWMNVYWWALRCSDRKETGCLYSKPSETTHCDIHYEPWIWTIYSGTTRGLIDFPGCTPATNPTISTTCKGNCGSNNTLWKGGCLRYPHLPLGNSSFGLYGRYMLSKRPDGICQKCDCYTWNRGLCSTYPQVFIVDIDSIA